MHFSSFSIDYICALGEITEKTVRALKATLIQSLQVHFIPHACRAIIKLIRNNTFSRNYLQTGPYRDLLYEIPRTHSCQNNTRFVFLLAPFLPITPTCTDHYLVIEIALSIVINLYSNTYQSEGDYQDCHVHMKFILIDNHDALKTKRERLEIATGLLSFSMILVILEQSSYK